MFKVFIGFEILVATVSQMLTLEDLIGLSTRIKKIPNCAVL